MEPSLKITVITVCYNSAATLADALQSVASQSWPQVEHIVVDGASTDGTPAILERYRTKLARVISEPDEGIYDAMNKGLRLATGDLVGFLNADDMLAEPDTLALIAQAGQTAPQADAVYGDLMYVDKDRPERAFRYWRSEVFKPSRLAFGWMPPHPTLYVRRPVIQALEGFDTGFRIAADYDFVLRLFSRPGRQFVYLPRVLVRMRTGGASNRSLRALFRKSSEDLRAMRRHNTGGLLTLLCKNFRKAGQFLTSSAGGRA